MAVSPSALASLVQSNVNTRMQAISGHAPLSQKDPSYFIEFTQAIGSGIISGAPTLILATNDSGSAGIPPIPGTGSGTGLTIQQTFFVEDLYTRIRGYVLADFGRTTHDAYPPSSGNSGNNLLAICQGIQDAFLAYYPTAWTLTSVNPDIYQGRASVPAGSISGVSATAVSGAILAMAPKLQGKFWPRIAQAVGESYAELINAHTATHVITGICVPGPSQVCNIRNSEGNGTGVAS